MQLNPRQKEGILNAVDLAMKVVADANPDQWVSLNHARNIIDGIPVTRRCPDCLHYVNGHCEHWAMPVPTDWIGKGCDEWDEDVPF